MANLNSENNWFQRWTWKTVGWASICFFLIACVTGLFTFLFDVMLFENQIGYAYHYFVLIFQTLILYFFYSKLKVNWIGTFVFGFNGLIGIGIELWLEYYSNPVLKSPWAAVGWGAIYVGYGLAADLSMYLVKVLESETLAIVISSMLFAAISIVLSIIPLKLFYIDNPEVTKDFLTYWYFLMPFGIIQSAIGAYAGMNLAKEKKMTTS